MLNYILRESGSSENKNTNTSAVNILQFNLNIIKKSNLYSIINFHTTLNQVLTDEKLRHIYDKGGHKALKMHAEGIELPDWAYSKWGTCCVYMTFCLTGCCFGCFCCCFCCCRCCGLCGRGIDDGGMCIYSLL